jgi:hypothetical protein
LPFWLRGRKLKVTNLLIHPYAHEALYVNCDPYTVDNHLKMLIPVLL